MEMNMGKFSEKLVELLELAKKKKNVLCLLYTSPSPRDTR